MRRWKRRALAAETELAKIRSVLSGHQPLPPEDHPERTLEATKNLSRRYYATATELMRRTPVFETAMALHGCGMDNIWPRVGDILDTTLAYMKSEVEDI